jgi:hypothetical protein
MAARGRGGEEMRERDRRRGGGRRTARPWEAVRLEVRDDRRKGSS